MGSQRSPSPLRKPSWLAARSRKSDAFFSISASAGCLDLNYAVNSRFSGLGFPSFSWTGLDDDSTARQALGMGCVALLRKPFPQGELIDAINKAGNKAGP